MAISVHCPYCGADRSVAEREFGHAVECVKCGADLSFDERIGKLKAEEDRRLARVEVDLAMSRRLEEQHLRVATVEAEERADQLRNIHGAGCPRCGSIDLTQASHITGVGWAFMAVGMALAVFTLGTSLIFTLFGFFLAEKRARCRKCRWKWRV